MLLGRNGAGKSTTLKSIMGVVPSREGKISFEGVDIRGSSSDAICRKGLGYVPEDCRIFRGLSVKENLDVARLPPRRPEVAAWDYIRVFELFPALRDLLRRRADSLSGGQQRMVAIARTLLGNPDLIMLDEPSEGLAPLVILQMADQLKALKATGVTILLAEQNLSFATTLADRIYILEKGEIKYEGTPKELTSDKSIKESYLTI